MKKIYILITLFIFNAGSITLLAQCTSNFLNNPSFETPVQTNIGNNLTGSTSFGGWTMTGGPFNVIKTNGSSYGGGPDNAQNGTQYIDITSAAGTVYQDFTITCTTDITFGGYFARREVGGTDFTAFVEIINLTTNTVIGTSTILNFTSATNQETWFNTTGTITALAPGNYRYRATIADFCNFDNALLCLSTPCILPIKFANFSADYNNCKTTLNWSVANQSNIQQFDIEYSNNGLNFSKIGQMVSLQNQQNYSFEHNTSSAKSYYRIKGIELNGSITYSKSLKLISDCKKTSVLIYPNPVIDHLLISITNNQSNLAKLTIYDWSGKLVVGRNLKNGTNDINLENLSKGVYSVKIQQNEESSKFTILKK